MNTDEDVIRLQIPGTLEYVSVARHAIDAVGEQLQMPPEDRMALKLAVGEACNNAVLHAQSGTNPAEGRLARCVVVACRVQPDALEIDVTNQGNGFHPEGAALMPVAEDLEEHGRGMALMEAVMDSVEYLSDNGNTLVRMRKLRGRRNGK